MTKRVRINKKNNNNDETTMTEVIKENNMNELTYDNNDNEMLNLSTYEDEKIAIDQGITIINESEDETKTSLIQKLGRLKIPATYIAKMLETHYSFVHTVLTKHNIEIIEKRTKSDEMREMFDAGMTVSEVSKQMGAHYSYVHGVYKRYMNKKGGE